MQAQKPKMLRGQWSTWFIRRAPSIFEHALWYSFVSITGWSDGEAAFESLSACCLVTRYSSYCNRWYIYFRHVLQMLFKNVQVKCLYVHIVPVMNTLITALCEYFLGARIGLLSRASACLSSSDFDIHRPRIQCPPGIPGLHCHNR